MKVIEEIRTLSAKSTEGLDHIVNEQLILGWLISGDMVIAIGKYNGGTITYYCQRLIKYNETKNH